MKKAIALILASVISFSLICGCGNSATAEKENATPTDADFIVNLGKGLDARWALTNSDAYSDEATASMSAADLQKSYATCVNAELDAIGKLEDYQFEDSELKTLAETYVKGLNLQKDGVTYIGTTDSTSYDRTWTLGYYYRAVCIAELYNNYGLTVDEKYKTDLNDFVAESTTAKKQIAIQDFVDALPDKLSYTKDEETSDEWTTYYKTVIENTTDYEITNLEIDVDFLDASGVVIAQTSDYLQNIQPGAKVQSKLMYSNNDGKFETMQYKVTAYTE